MKNAKLLWRWHIAASYVATGPPGIKKNENDTNKRILQHRARSHQCRSDSWLVWSFLGNDFGLPFGRHCHRNNWAYRVSKNCGTQLERIFKNESCAQNASVASIFPLATYTPLIAVRIVIQYQAHYEFAELTAESISRIADLAISLFGNSSRHFS